MDHSSPRKAAAEVSRPAGALPLVPPEVKEINRLHGEVQATVGRTGETFIQIGGLLKKLKAKCARGRWGRFLKANVRFSEQAAESYIWLYRHRAELMRTRFKSASFGPPAPQSEGPAERPHSSETATVEWSEASRPGLVEPVVSTLPTGAANTPRYEAIVRQPEPVGIYLAGAARNPIEPALRPSGIEPDQVQAAPDVSDPQVAAQSWLAFRFVERTAFGLPKRQPCGIGWIAVELFKDGPEGETARPMTAFRDAALGSEAPRKKRQRRRSQ